MGFLILFYELKLNLILSLFLLVNLFFEAQCNLYF